MPRAAAGPSVRWPLLELPLTFAMLGVTVLAAVVWMAVAAPDTRDGEFDSAAIHTDPLDAAQVGRAGDHPDASTSAGETPVRG